MLVGEAPGRLGAGRTGVPFSGDVAGRRFGCLLAATGLARQDVFVTNALLCVPLDAHGRNRAPARAELSRCRRYLAETIGAVEPSIVVAMGRVALESLRHIESHSLSLADAGQPPVGWLGRRLAVVYHPGARSQVHRPWERQLEDWRRLGVEIRGPRV